MTQLASVQLTPKERELLTIIGDPVRFCEKILAGQTLVVCPD